MITVWVYSTFLLLTQATAKADVAIGTLNFELKYENREGLLHSGKKCDTFLWNYLCDVFFRICIYDNMLPRLCHVYEEETKPIRNTVSFKHRFSVDYETNDELTMEIDVMDHDVTSAPDLIGSHTYYLRPPELQNRQILNETQLVPSKQSPKITIMVEKFCKPQHYGNECKPCPLPPEQGYCDSEGNPVCYPGKSCELDSDPCSKRECPPGEVCVRTGEKGEGARCAALGGAEEQFSDDACALEEARLGHPPCKNGGHCVSTKNGTLFSCLCYNGWHGNRCEVSISQAITMGITVTAIVLVLVISVVIAVLCCCRYLVLPRLRYVIDSKKGLEMQSLRVAANKDEGCRENNLYVGVPTASRPPRSRSSFDGCSTTTDKHAGHFLPSVPSASEYDPRVYEEMPPTFFPEAYRPICETDYEPISLRAHSRQPTAEDSESLLSSDGYDTLPSNADNQAEVKPSAEAKSEEYEYLCKE